MAIIKLDDGRYAMRTEDASGKRHYKTFRKGTPYKTVTKAHDKARAERDLVRHTDSTVAMLADDYIATRGRKLSPKGLVRAKGIVEKIKADPIGKEVAAELRPHHFDDWQTSLEDDDYSPATIDRMANTLRAVLYWAVRRGKLSLCPIKRGDMQRRVPSSKTVPIHFSREEWAAFITALDDDAHWQAYVAAKRTLGPVKIGATIDTPRRYGAGRKPDSRSTAEYREHLLSFRPLWRAYLLTGARLSELLTLTWNRVDLRAGTIALRQSKTETDVTVPISASLRADLEALPRGIGKAFVYARPDGRQRTDAETARAFKVYRNAARHVCDPSCDSARCTVRFGLRQALTIHKLRHTCASWIIQNGGTLKDAQEILGHASIATTMKYAHLLDQHLRRAVSLIELGMATSPPPAVSEPGGGEG